MENSSPVSKDELFVLEFRKCCCNCQPSYFVIPRSDLHFPWQYGYRGFNNS